MCTGLPDQNESNFGVHIPIKKVIVHMERRTTYVMHRIKQLAA
jgi:hypothetical protein